MTNYNAFDMTKQELRKLAEAAALDIKVKRLPKAPAYVAPPRYRAIKNETYWPGRN